MKFQSVCGHPASSESTIMRGRSFEGITEVRPGVYTLFDLAQFYLGLCALSDIVASALATVIGHNWAARALVIDAGALALSMDISASEFRSDIGYGLVQSLPGTVPLSGGPCVEHGLVGPDGRQ